MTLKNIHVIYLTLHPWKINLRDSNLKISIVKHSALGGIIGMILGFVAGIIYSQSLINFFGNTSICTSGVKRLGCDPTYLLGTLIVFLIAGSAIGTVFGYLRKIVENKKI